MDLEYTWGGELREHRQTRSVNTELLNAVYHLGKTNRWDSSIWLCSSWFHSRSSDVSTPIRFIGSEICIAEFEHCTYCNLCSPIVANRKAPISQLPSQPALLRTLARASRCGCYETAPNMTIIACFLTAPFLDRLMIKHKWSLLDLNTRRHP